MARRFAAPLPALVVALAVAPVVTFVAGPSAAEEAPADVRAVERAMVPMRLSVPMGEGGTPYELEGFAYPEPVTVLRDGVPTAAGGADDPFVRFAREMLAAMLSADVARTLALWRPDADAEEIALVRGTLGGDMAPRHAREVAGWTAARVYAVLRRGDHVVVLLERERADGRTATMRYAATVGPEGPRASYGLLDDPLDGDLLFATPKDVRDAIDAAR